jgi:hypothetical protein
VAIEDTLAYVADGNSGLQIVNVADPSEPHLVGSVNTPGFAADVFVEGTRAYVADKDGGLQIVGVEEPEQPYQIGSYGDWGSAWAVEVHWPLVYVANGRAGLLILNATDPENPQLVGALDTPGLAKDVHVSEGLAFIADGDSGVVIIDVHDPGNPSVQARYDTPLHAFALDVSGELIYVADLASLMVLRHVSTGVDAASDEREGPRGPGLLQNRPNPFNRETVLAFDLNEESISGTQPISLKIYNIRGQLVRVLVEDRLSAGRHQVTWDGMDLNGLAVESGIYPCVLKTHNSREMRKLVLLR